MILSIPFITILFIWIKLAFQMLFVKCYKVLNTGITVKSYIAVILDYVLQWLILRKLIYFCLIAKELCNSLDMSFNLFFCIW